MSVIIETLSKDPGIMLGGLLASMGIIAATIISVTAIVSDCWRKMRTSEDTVSLKQNMLDRGMSAADIATVISATPEKRASFSFNAGRHRMHSRG